MYLPSKTLSSVFLQYIISVCYFNNIQEHETQFDCYSRKLSLICFPHQRSTDPSIQIFHELHRQTTHTHNGRTLLY